MLPFGECALPEGHDMLHMTVWWYAALSCVLFPFGGRVLPLGGGVLP